MITSADQQIHELECRIDELEWENKGIAEWRDRAIKMEKMLNDTERVIVNHAIAMLNQIGLTGAEADAIYYSPIPRKEPN